VAAAIRESCPNIEGGGAVTGGAVALEAATNAWIRHL